jgi:hypothetical protein
MPKLTRELAPLNPYSTVISQLHRFFTISVLNIGKSVALETLHRLGDRNPQPSAVVIRK